MSFIVRQATGEGWPTFDLCDVADSRVEVDLLVDVFVVLTIGLITGSLPIEIVVIWDPPAK